jgi:haloalkane dehalogenase
VHYRIRIRGELDSSWQPWFEGLQIQHAPGGATLLSGWLPDQPALYRVLLKINRLGLALLALDSSEAAQQSGTAPEA